MIHSRGLRLAYTPAVSIRFPDLAIESGSTVLLRGDSGSGKSTLLALIAGLLTPTEGRLEVAGTDLARLRGPARDRWRARTLGFLPQRLHLSPALSVHANLELVPWAAGDRKSAADIGSLLQRLGLAELAGRLPHELSGGQAQRVALARALVMSPPLLLADEPTASLDDKAAMAAMQSLQEAAALVKATLVIATHDARVVEAFGTGAREVRL